VDEYDDDDDKVEEEFVVCLGGTSATASGGAFRIAFSPSIGVGEASSYSASQLPGTVEESLRSNPAFLSNWDEV